MELPECRYQFCHDSHDLAAGQLVGTLSKFIGRSTVRKQPPPSPSPSPSSECFMIFLCARAYLIRPGKTLLSWAKKLVPVVGISSLGLGKNKIIDSVARINMTKRRRKISSLLHFLFVLFFSFALYHFKWLVNYLWENSCGKSNSLQEYLHSCVYRVFYELKLENF